MNAKKEGKNNGIVLLDLATVAERLAISLHTARRWATGGRLPVVRLGRAVRVLESDLQELVERGHREARGDVRVA
jgi:excisionase family DNA binding protein